MTAPPMTDRQSLLTLVFVVVVVGCVYGAAVGIVGT